MVECYWRHCNAQLLDLNSLKCRIEADHLPKDPERGDVICNGLYCASRLNENSGVEDSKDTNLQREFACKQELKAQVDFHADAIVPLLESGEAILAPGSYYHLPVNPSAILTMRSASGTSFAPSLRV